MERIRLNIFIVGLFTLAFHLNANSQLLPLSSGGTDVGNVVADLGKSKKESKLKKHIAPAVAVFVSGGFEGVMDHLQFHYDGNSQFWQPDISWVNKYKNRDTEQGKTFRGKYLVFTTDGWHLMKFGGNLSMFTGFTLILSKEFSGSNRKKWYWYIIEGMAYWAINRAGFTITYNLLK